MLQILYSETTKHHIGHRCQSSTNARHKTVWFIYFSFYSNMVTCTFISFAVPVMMRKKNCGLKDGINVTRDSDVVISYLQEDCRLLLQVQLARGSAATCTCHCSWYIHVHVFQSFLGLFCKTKILNLKQYKL